MRDWDHHSQKAKRAAWLYAIGGTLIVIGTLLHPELATEERRSDLIYLLMAIPAVYIFAFIIAKGHQLFKNLFSAFTQRSEEENAASGLRWHVVLLWILIFTNSVRCFIYITNALGMRFRLKPLGFEAVPPTPSFWVEAMIMFVIVAALLSVVLVVKKPVLPQEP